jgi:integrase
VTITGDGQTLGPNHRKVGPFHLNTSKNRGPLSMPGFCILESIAMASVNKDSKGWRVMVVMPDGQRKTIRLTGMNKAKAEQVGRHVDELVQAKGSGQPIERQTALWLPTIGQKLHDKLSNAGLIHQRVSADLGEFVAEYIHRRSDVKPGTTMNLKSCERNLVDFFGASKPMRSITVKDATLFRQWLLDHEQQAENTLRRRCGRARQFFKAAVKARLIDENPFEGMPVTVTGNRSKERFVTEEESQMILKACPDAQWRLIFSLCRYGGVRCPSEIVSLTWGDILWDADRIIVRSPKTERYKGQDSRVIPMFPELLIPLREVFEQAPPGTVPVITRYRRANQNLRTTFDKIVTRAGLTLWDKPFQNLRATRETELMEIYPAHVVVAWIGHSEKVARKHYLQMTDAHFERATGKIVAQSVAQQDTV